jgi:hypothetical protein
MFVDRRLGGMTRWHLSPPRDYLMRLPDEVRESVVFVGRVIPVGGREERRLLGTAFVVGVVAEDDPNVKCLYLVTARHVAAQLSLGGPWFVRFNTKEGGFVDADRDSPGIWWTHPEEPDSADAAVEQLFDLPEGVELRHVPEEMLATEKVIREVSIGPGDAVNIVGLFTKMTGRQRNIPIVRTGNVAMIPSERVPGIEICDATHESDVYLIEARSVGGLSGSPVYVTGTVIFPGFVDQLGKTVNVPLHGNIYLLGLMHGHWDVKESEINEVRVRAVKGDRQGVNVGIAVVVPAQKIFDILRRDELVHIRGEVVKALRRAEGTTSPD